jgi:hypothetical protein
MLFSMMGMAIVAGATYIASILGVLWYMLGIEVVVVIVVYNLMNRTITNRVLVRHHDQVS